MSGMSRGMVGLVGLLLVLGLAWTSAARAADPSLVGWWTFEEGSGTTAHDSSSNKNDGTLRGNPQWMDGEIGKALRFGGTADYVEVPDSASLRVTDTITIAAWVFRQVNTGTWERIVAKSDATLYDYWLQISASTYASSIGGGFMDSAGTARNILDTTTGPTVPLNQWTHLAFVYDGTFVRGYMNGQQVESVNIGPYKIRTGARPLWVGRLQNAYAFQGLIDEACVFSRALTQAEIQGIMNGLGGGASAAAPTPADLATDVPRDATLNWAAGQYPGTHDVYFGTIFADVNTAARTASNSVLASQGQTATTFDPAGLLAYGQTYYWRIDEVNDAPDKTIFKGNVWSFTAEPYAYPITKVTATASSSQPGMTPDKTVSGSGLDKSDLHGTDGATMWLSTGALPNWIQFQFDAVYKVYDLKVWNSNQILEPFVGFGAKDVKIEYSTDGITWTALANVPPFARAPGTPSYAADTTISFGGVDAKFVKLTINSTWSGIPTAGLSEVRFSYVPLQARLPQPANAATKVKLDAALDWRPGRLAASHKVYFGTDVNAVTTGTVAAKTVAEHGYLPGSLNFGTKYYWRVDEVNTVTYPGAVWNFTTQEFAVVDDFETYNDKEPTRVFDAWMDGFTNNTSSVVGLFPDAIGGTFCDTTTYHSSRQSMPVEYNNIKPPYYSEATRTFDTPQNWTGSGADTLSLWFRGRPVAFADKGNNAFTISSSGTGIQGNADQFRFVYKQLTGDGSITLRVDSLINTNAWARAGGMIRGTLNAGSRNAMMEVTAGSGVPFQWRLADSGTTSSNNTGTTGMVAPQWVRLTRTGDVVKGERSTDGKTWTQQGTDMTIAMPSAVYIGMAVTSQNANASTVAEISNVSTTGTVTGQWQMLAIGATMSTNGPAPVYLVVEDKAGKKKTVVHANPAASTTAAWTEWRVPLSDLTAAGVNLTAVKKLTIGVGDAASPKAGAVGMLYVDDIGYGHPVK